MKGIFIICLMAISLLVLGNGCNRTQNDSSNKDDDIVTEQQGFENHDETEDEIPDDSQENTSGDEIQDDTQGNETGNENKDAAQGDETGDESQDSTQAVKFYISYQDVFLDEGFECINDNYKEIIKEFVRMNLLGYGGNALLGDIKEINDRIFTEDSPNREDYIARMDAYVAGVHDNYLNGYSEVEFRGNFEKTNDSISLKIRINHILTRYDIQTDSAYDQITTSVKYTLVLTMKDGNVYIKSCEPDKRNDFDGEIGSREVSVAGRVIDVSDLDMEVLESNEQLSEEEKEVLGKFYAELIYALGGYEYIEEVETLHEEIFWAESVEQYDYMARIEKAPAQYMKIMKSEIREVQDISGTEKERKLTFSVWICDYAVNGELISAFENIYWLTLKEIDNKVYIVSCIPHELNLEE